jgi:tetratricopeptide (TPR) repeat protein
MRAVLLVFSAFFTVAQPASAALTAPGDRGNHFAKSLPHYRADCSSLDFPKAIAACTSVIEDRLAPKNTRAFALHNRGSAYEYLGHLADAMADFNELIRLLPNGFAFADRGLVYLDRQEYDRAIVDLTKAIELDPRWTSAYKWRGTAYFYTGRNDRAIADFDTAIRLDPTSGELYWRRGKAHEVAHDLTAALTDYSDALAIDPKSLRDYVSRALVFLKLGNAERALDDSNAALRIEPNNVHALTARGNAYRARGELDRAIDDYSTAIAADPFVARTYYERGVAYRLKGDRAHAIDDFKHEVHSLPKDSPEAVAELKALGVDMSHYDPMKLPKAKNLINSLK